ncbi:MAG: diacylglycerol kinase family protein [Candidatus Paceibacterota bacterium]|jgi:diacylglycerol kinase
MENNELTKKEKKRFSIIARVRSANHAWRGIKIIFASGHNTWGFVFFSLLAIYLGFLLHISITEWCVLVLIIGIVFITEAINTAIEIDINLTSPVFHPYARDTKDVAAGASLLSVFFAIIIGIIIFVPKIYGLYF